MVKNFNMKVYSFASQAEEDHITRWEDYITDEMENMKEKEVKDTIDYKLDQNGEK